MKERFGAKGVALASVVAFFGAVLASNGVFAAGETLSEIFTSAKLRGCVVNALQTELDSTIDETSVLTAEQLGTLSSLSCVNQSLTNADLVGLDSLTGLTTLALPNNAIDTIDLSANTDLERLILANNALTALDLSNNTNLLYLDVRNNTGLDLEALDVTPTKLTDMTDAEGIWEVVTQQLAEAPITREATSNEQKETQACESWNIDDETISVFKGLLSAYGYDTSRYDASAVKMAASQTNMCDGMDINEARTLMNAMGIKDLSNAELGRIAEMVTNAYKAINDGATLEQLLSASGVPLVPNTGINTGGFNANVVVLSLGVVMLGAGVFYMVHYGLKRKEAKVTFRRW